MATFTEQEANSFLAATKVAKGPLLWIHKLKKDDGEWMEARCAGIQFATAPGEALEGVFITCQCRKSHPPKSDVVTFSLIVGSMRIYAIDIQPDHMHINKVGKGKPFYKKTIFAAHEHVWTDEGYGYAEPCAITKVEDYKRAWELFLLKAGIEFDGDLDFPEMMIQADLF